MISCDQALAIMLAAARRLGDEPVAFENAVGRVLAQDVLSDIDMPPFDKSAVDGYACQRSDLDQWLTITQTVAAGQMPTQPIAAGQCAKIMTGAPIPGGADCVMMIEHTQTDATGRVHLSDGRKVADNICRQGEDARTGDIVLSAGTVITPAHIAILAAVGCTRPMVARRPRLAIIATGDELTAATTKPAGACIRDSNSYQLQAQCQAIAIESRRMGIVGDDAEALAAAVEQACQFADLIVFSGGVSTGEFDLVPNALRRAGFRLFFESVAMQPGRPMIFGDDGQRFCCGLPGNPVATFVIFEILLKPFLYRMMGHDYRPTPIVATLAEGYTRRKADRRATIPVAFAAPAQVTPVAYHGSAHIAAVGRAQGLISIPIGVTEVPAGSQVDVRLL